MNEIKEYIRQFEEVEGEGSKFMSKEDLEQFLLGFLQTSSPFILGSIMGQNIVCHNLFNNLSNN